MTVDFDAVGSVLRTYDTEEQNAIEEMAVTQCQSDGIDSTFVFWKLAVTYKAIVLLALGDSLTESIGDISRARTNTNALANQYEGLYSKLLNDNGHYYSTQGGPTSDIPSII